MPNHTSTTQRDAYNLNSSQRGLRGSQALNSSMRLVPQTSIPPQLNISGQFGNSVSVPFDESRTNLHAFQNNEGVVPSLERRRRRSDANTA